MTWGLFAAWAVHDTEELLTMSRWGRSARRRLAARHPEVPEFVWRALDRPQTHVNVAIGLVGAVMAAAAADGARTGGRSGFYQAALLGFGGHAATHLAQAVAVRGYTPGLLTTPLVVVPYSLWAWLRLRRAGVAGAGGRLGWASAALLPVTLGAAHGIAAAVTRGRGRARGITAAAGRSAGPGRSGP
ncbi:HXXEE domain-containing protein [Marinitenerispora sediminis]|uniref:HXXEE domain-containing protein n=1 Tax=Marinitenerispora sediminis TaxID=1931232 RepID=A0A368T9M6_9ACTN|nr:HXXEE domain-containing protein [Marinitenerispora sediminis]RCV59922.1 HXXEE domain-containing protein [Marinitenerispora sediminis]RCV61338.1 HXXEE domain-containing protein [Marinitenerispora sediminis]